MADFKCVVCKHHYTPSDSPPCDNCEYIGDGRYSAYSPCTNADRIRSMTDAELANRIVCHVSCSCCPLEQEDCKKHCYELWLEWLKQDVKNE